MTPAPGRGRQNLWAHILLVAVTVVWGTTFPLVKAALREAPPLAFNFVRMLVASLVLCAVNWRSLRGITGKQWRVILPAGLFLALGYELQTTGLTRTTPSKSAFLTGLVVVLVPLLSSLPGLRSAGTPKLSALAYAGAAVAFAGIVLLTSDPAAGWSLLAGLHMGEWLTLGCALAFAIHLLTLARGAGVVGARTLGTLQITVAAGVMLLFLPLAGSWTIHWTPVVLIAFFVTSLLATAAAFTIQSWAQQHLQPSHTALILTLEPVFAALTSFVLLGERMGKRALLGAALILGGIVLAELGPTALSQAAVLPVEP